MKDSLVGYLFILVQHRFVSCSEIIRNPLAMKLDILLKWLTRWVSLSGNPGLNAVSKIVNRWLVNPEIRFLISKRQEILGGF
jgi:hypothetical protein